MQMESVARDGKLTQEILFAPPRSTEAVMDSLVLIGTHYVCKLADEPHENE